jgi:hypothetical protein
MTSLTYLVTTAYKHNSVIKSVGFYHHQEQGEEEDEEEEPPTPVLPSL